MYLDIIWQKIWSNPYNEPAPVHFAKPYQGCHILQIYDKVSWKKLLYMKFTFNFSLLHTLSPTQLHLALIVGETRMNWDNYTLL